MIIESYINYILLFAGAICKIIIEVIGIKKALRINKEIEKKGGIEEFHTEVAKLKLGIKKIKYLSFSSTIAMLILISITIWIQYFYTEVSIESPQENTIIENIISIQGNAKNIPIDQNIVIFIWSKKYNVYYPILNINKMHGNKWEVENINIGSYDPQDSDFKIIIALADEFTLNEYEKLLLKSDFSGIGNIEKGGKVRIWDEVIVRKKSY